MQAGEACFSTVPTDLAPLRMENFAQSRCLTSFLLCFLTFLLQLPVSTSFDHSVIYISQSYLKYHFPCSQCTGNNLYNVIHKNIP